MNLHPGESVLRLYRQTPAVLLGYFLLAACLAYLPINFLEKYSLEDSLGRLPFFWQLAMIVYFLNHFLLWRLNYTLLTNQRMVAITYHNLLFKQVTDLPKDKIVNIAYEKKGILPAIFGYGNVILQQQSIAKPVILKRLSNPSAVKDEIIAMTRV